MALLARSSFVFVLLFLVSTAGIGQELTLQENLESAWQDYKLAVETNDAESLVEAAERVHTFGDQFFEASDERFAIIAFNHGKAFVGSRQAK